MGHAEMECKRRTGEIGLTTSCEVVRFYFLTEQDDTFSLIRGQEITIGWYEDPYNAT